MLTRYDTAPIREMTTDAQTGFIHVTDVPIARVGVFPYMKADGSVEMEAKLPTELLSDSTVQSANNRPITNDHPNGLVTKDNATQLAKGFTADNAHVENGTLRVDMTIMDGKLIDAINNGKQELSIGFQTDVAPAQGEYQGVKYDSVQKNIQINHVAVVKRGRAGHSVRLIGDSAEMVEDVPDSKKGQQMEYTKMRLDSVDESVTVADKDVDAVTKLDADNSAKAKKIADLKSQIADLQKQLDQLQGTADTNKKNADEAQAKADSLDKELTETKKKYEGDAFDKAVQDRMNLIEKVKPFVGDSFDFTGKTPRDMKVEAIKANKTVDDSIDLDSKSDDYINGVFDQMHQPEVVGYNGPETKGDSAESKTMKLRDMRYHLADKGGNN